MQKFFKILTQKFRKNRGKLSFEAFEKIKQKYCSYSEDSYTFLLFIQALGYPIEEKIDGLYYKPYFTLYKKDTYCVIDIETNGAKPGRSQVIEIGAIKIKDLKVVDRLETFVSCAYVPDNIIELTGITPTDLIDAPSQKEAFLMLRDFLEDNIFVAHNVAFDYQFLNESFKRFGLGEIANPLLCTMDLAKKSIKAQKYGLAFLSEHLNINNPQHHRAYNDAKIASQIMLESFKYLPNSIKTTDELIRFVMEKEAN
ncbi:MAG: 3'-5' exonuclease [Epsilonproteobacteria bacterium]|nr:3'-5' exonuclease [Campylobacterota bacterium]